jgi:hypothetical protein
MKNALVDHDPPSMVICKYLVPSPTHFWWPIARLCFQLISESKSNCLNGNSNWAIRERPNVNVLLSLMLSKQRVDKFILPSTKKSPHQHHISIWWVPELVHVPLGFLCFPHLCSYHGGKLQKLCNMGCHVMSYDHMASKFPIAMHNSATWWLCKTLCMHAAH